MSDDKLVLELVELRRSIPGCDDPMLKAEKMRRVHGRGLNLQLADGGHAWVDEIDIAHTYLGVLDGIPPADFMRVKIDQATAFARERLPGPEPVLLPPRCFDPGSPYPILAPLRFVAQVVSWRQLEPDAYGSWINLVWFADIDDEKSVTQFVADALAQVDWDRQAASFDY